TAAESTAAAGCTGCTFLRLVNRKRTAIEHSAVHLLHRFLSACFVRERHEPKSTGPSGIAIGHHFGGANLSKPFKSRAETVFICVPAEAAYKESITHSVLSFVDVPQRYREVAVTVFLFFLLALPTVTNGRTPGEPDTLRPPVGRG